MWRCKKCGSTDIKIVEEMGTRYSSNVDKEGQGIYDTQEEDGSSDYYLFVEYRRYDCGNNTDKNIEEISDWIE